MKLLTPNWVSHDGKPVFSVHIHPDSSRFATGGQGGDAGLVAVWNMEPVRSAEAEVDAKIPKLLCSMTNHLSCVNCVRWSNQGKFLASGSDDNDVMIWRCSGSGNHRETWSCAHILRGHGGDVLDLAWSPDDTYLATASVDNSIIVWSVASFATAPEIKTKLTAHEGMVKGVAWDPIGKYLASQSDDKSLRVWRTSDWKEEGSVFGPFDKCGAVTHVLRLGWSPDGSYVVSTHALNNDGPVAKIVERGTWKACMDFVGHRKAVEVVSFNPKLFRRNGETYTCCAVGGRDRTLSIWLTCYRRPLIVLHDLFSNSILDISWGSSGFELLVCSHAGSVAYLSFSQSELGQRLSESETNRTMKNLYGFVPGRLLEQGANTLIENPSFLQLRQGTTSSKDGFSPVTNGRKPAPSTPLTRTASDSLPPSTSVTPTGSLVPPMPCLTIAPVANFSSSSQPASIAQDTVKQQQESRTKDGRRRIAPVLLASKTTASTVPAPFGKLAAPFADASPPPPTTVPSTPTTVPNTSTSSMSSAGLVTASTAAAAAAAPASSTSAQQKSAAETSPHDESVAKPMSIQPLSPDKRAAPGGSTAATRGPKRKMPELAPTGKRTRKEAPATKALPTASSSTAESSGKSRHEVASSATASVPSSRAQLLGLSGARLSAACLPQPEIQTTQTVTVTTPKVGDLVFETRNTPGSQPNSLVCSQGGQKMWNIATFSRIVLLAASRHVAAVATEDRCLTLLSSQGRRLLPRLNLPGGVHLLAASGHFVAVVTTTGAATVWDCRSLEQVAHSESVLGLLNDGERLSSLDVASSGSPLVTVSALRTFIYCSKMMAWLLIGDAEDPINRLSSYAVRKSSAGDMRSAASGSAVGGTGSSDAATTKGHSSDLQPLARLQGLVCADSNREGAMRAGSLLRQDGTQTVLANQAFLEHQVASALALESHAEYRAWLMAYVRYLTQESMEAILKDLCSSLMKGLHNRSASSDQLFVLGISKNQLLKDILVIMARNLSLQRLVAQLQDQLAALPSHSASKS